MHVSDKWTLGEQTRSSHYAIAESLIQIVEISHTSSGNLIKNSFVSRRLAGSDAPLSDPQN